MPKMMAADDNWLPLLRHRVPYFRYGCQLSTHTARTACTNQLPAPLLPHSRPIMRDKEDSFYTAPPIPAPSATSGGTNSLNVPLKDVCAFY